MQKAFLIAKREAREKYTPKKYKTQNVAADWRRFLRLLVHSRLLRRLYGKRNVETN